MRVAIVVPSEQYLALAGARIRYQRLVSRMLAAGHSLDLVQISSFHRNVELDHDIYIFSKCYDARSLITAHHLANHGKTIAVDVFDDYFSQGADARFVRQRGWLLSIGRLCDFFLCSTPRMRDVVARFMPHVSGHILNDPFAAFDTEGVRTSIKAKAAVARTTCRLDVAWFGIGDNPNFPVGLDDLAAFGGALSTLTARGFDVHLRILTNRRALTVHGLEAVRRLSVPFAIEEWTEERERELIDHSFLAFLPVNAQAFSIAKSLNRAVTALTGGLQVLSPGFPLYEPLGDFIYRDPHQLADDLARGRLKVRPGSIGALSEQLRIWGDPDQEAGKLIAFLEALPEKAARPDGRTNRPVALMHGLRSSADCHKSAQRLGYLSVGTPFSNPGLNYDICFREISEVVQLEISPTAARHVLPRVARILRSTKSATRREVLGCDLNEALPRHPLSAYRSVGDQPPAVAAVYADTMHLVRDAISRLVPGVTVYLSETESPHAEGLEPARRAPPVALSALCETVT